MTEAQDREIVISGSGETKKVFPIEKEVKTDPVRLQNRTKLQQKVEKKLLSLNDLGLPEGDVDQIEAKGIFERITEKKKDDPTSSYFLLINKEIGKYEDQENYESLLIVQRLKDARNVIIDEARSLGLWDNLREDLISAQENISSWDDIMNELEKISSRAEKGKYGRTITKEGGEAEEVPYYDLIGVCSAYAETTLNRAKLTLLQVRGEEDTDEAKRLQAKVDLYSWGTPPPNRLIDKAKIHAGVGTAEQLQGTTSSKTQEDLLRLLNQNIEILGQSTQEQVDIQKLILNQEELSYDLARRGLGSFIRAEETRARLNPEQFDQVFPPWYEKLSEKERGMIRARLALNYQASVMRDFGMFDLKTITSMTGLRFERKDFENLWKEMPGFRLVMATMMSELFDPTKDHFVFTKEAISERIGDQAKLEEYKKSLKSRLKKHFRSQNMAPVFKEKYIEYFKESDDKVLDDMATSAVSAVDNMFLAFGVYASADEQRKITGASNICPEQLRAFYQPGLKGMNKWLGENYGGPLGGWIRANIYQKRDERENSVMDKIRRPLEFIYAKATKGMTWNEYKERDRKIIENHQMRQALKYFPRRLFYDGLSHTAIMQDVVQDDGEVKEDKISLGRLMLWRLTRSGEHGREMANNQVGDSGLVDFVGGQNAIDLKKIVPDEINGYVNDYQGDILKLYKHLTSNDPRDRISAVDLTNLISKTQSDVKLKNMLVNKKTGRVNYELLQSCIGLIISPERGFVPGSWDTIVDYGDAPAKISSDVEKILKSEILSDFLSRSDKNELRKRLKAADTGSIFQTIFSLIAGNASFPYNRAREKAKVARARYLNNEIRLFRDFRKP